MKYLRRSKNVFLGFLVASIAALSFVCVKNSQQNTVHAWDGSTATHPSVGSGRSTNPYLIASAENLAWFRDRITTGGYGDECAKLTANIDLSGKSWSPIGKSNSPFVGTLDGNGYTISNLYFNGSGTDYVGLVGYAGNNSFTANIRNIKLSNVNITGRDYVGAICGYGRAQIDNCQTINGTVSGRKNVAGVVGYIEEGSVESSSNGANISNSGSGCCCCAGIAGYVLNCHDISYSYNTGTISGHEETGGVCAYARGGIDIVGCYNSGAVNSNGYDYCGGIVSDVGGSNNVVIILQCYNAGNIAGGSNVAGILGARWNDSKFTGIRVAVDSCHNFGDISYSGLNWQPIVGNFTGFSNVTVENSYCKWDLAPTTYPGFEGIKKTTAQFASGEVAYLLNGSTIGSGNVWKQNLDNGQTANAYPVFSGGTVYSRKYCDNTFAKYSNSSTVIHRHTNNNHYDTKGFCNRNSCGGYQTATLINSYYQINNVGNLFWFAALVNGDKSKADFSSQNKSANAYLIANIDLENRAWTPIGNSSTNTFLGTFDGANYTISNLKVSRSGLDNNGLVGWCGLYDGNASNNTATLNNVNITGATIEGQNYTGILLGWGRANISNCHTSGIVLGSNRYTGGMVGELYQGTITGCSNAANVKGNWKAAGICGNIKYGGTVSYCYNTGNITGVDGSLTTPQSAGNYHAGIVAAFGDVADNHTTPSTITANIQNCYNVGSICGSGGVTGIVGAPDAGTFNNGIAMTCNISNCHNFGDIMAGGNDAGYMLSSKNRCTPVVTNCYYKSDCIKSTTTNLSGAGLGTSKTEAQFASGEVTYLLNGSTGGLGNGWKQNLDSGTPDDYPVFNSGVVYNVKYCDNSASTQYSNTSGKILHRETSNYQYNSEGFCTRNNCGGYQTATLNGDYYQINNAGKLFWFAALVNGDHSKADFSSQNRSANAKLTANIDLGNRAWTPIGLCTGHTVGALYNGTFDGQYHTVSGVKADSTSNTLFYSGLFGGAEGSALIKNVGVLNSSFVATKSAGGILGGTTTAANTVSVQNCWADNCTMSVTVTSDANQAAGIVGGMWNDSSPIAVTNCYVHTITAPGSIVGQASNNAISNCYTLTNKPIAAKAGTNVTNCYYKDYSDSQGTSKTAQQFASGEVAYLLNGSTSGSEKVWKQNLDIGTPDASPVFSGGIVYNIKYCDNNDSTQYTNTSGKILHRHTNDTHYDSKGFCNRNSCGGYQTATLNGDYYQIDNAGKLFWFASVVNDDHSKADFSSQNTSANAKLIANIDLENSAWTPIGNGSTNTFLGTFDGNGYTISNLYINGSGTDHVGLVGHAGNNSFTANIRNIKLSNVNITGRDYVGAICGYGKALIDNCQTINGIVSGRNNVAGVVGYIDGGGINNSSNGANISNFDSDCSCCAGVAGYVTNCHNISDSYNTGTISGYKETGGVCAYVKNGVNIDGCYNSGAVNSNGYDYCGGIVSDVGGSNNDVIITQCYNAGNITGGSNVAGILGARWNNSNFTGIRVTIDSCHNFGNISASSGANYAPILGDESGLYSIDVRESYYKSDSANSSWEGIQKTAAQFSSGEVAYLLNGSTSGSGNVWKQNLDSGTPDAYPVFSGGIVYNIKYCDNNDSTQYSNTSGKVIHRHIDSSQYENGFCSNGGCGWYEIPNLSDGYYQIDNAGKLFWFASVVNDDHSKADFSSQNTSANAKLIANINLENRAWTPIGNSSTNTFLGTFDGANYTINNLNVSRSGIDNNGLVGRCGLYDGNASNNTATLKNVNITGATIEGKNYTGILLGGGRANISNCHVSGTITNSNNWAGGIVGEIYQGTVTGCSNAAAVKGRWKAAGICGSIKYGGTVSNCYNTGNITGVDGSLTTPQNGENYHAGIVGGFGSAADDYTTPSTITTDVQNCYNVGNICGFGGATGIVGSPDAGAFTNGISMAINISNCYNYGNIIPGNNITGHILANKNDCTHNVTNSYYKEGCLTATNPNSADLGTSKTAEEFANWAVKDLLQAYVNDHSSDGLCNWAQGGSYPIFDTGNFENPTVTWNGDFTFSITKTWDPKTHTYSGSWQAQQTGDNIVINNPDLKAKLRVTPSFGDKATEEFDVKFYKDAVEITGSQEVGLGQALTIIIKAVEGQCDVLGSLANNLLGRINLNITR